MISHDLGDGFRAVPYDAVTLNGMYLSQINTREGDYNGSWRLVAPNNYAVDGEDNRPYRYESLQDAMDDKTRLVKSGEFSTCGGVVKLDSCKTATVRKQDESKVVMPHPAIKYGINNPIELVVTRDETGLDKACDIAWVLARTKVGMDDDGYMAAAPGLGMNCDLILQFSHYQRKSEHHLYFFQCWIEKREDDEDEDEIEKISYRTRWPTREDADSNGHVMKYDSEGTARIGDWDGRVAVRWSKIPESKGK